ncbi:MAG: tannase/feruloyl esterase family alpha/beta hydrolase [Gammaproteobacteria bacterium]|nr:tannase/feruloyl esterase family alpha/beta hydrolase [Gammaproteobacteria bacterium]
MKDVSKHWQIMSTRAAFAIALMLGLILPASEAQAQGSIDAERCYELRGLAVEQGRVVAASLESSGSFRSPDKIEHTELPPFCRTVIVSSSEPGSRIVTELWLPLDGHWNGKMLGTGNAGFAGAVRYNVLAGGLKRGYAVANTDMGTAPASSAGIFYDAGNGQPAMISDWGHRATHLMTVAAKHIILELYGKAQTRSYFVGCSTGGHQGLAEAQRYPEDYDGILAGAPGHNRTHLHTAFNYNFQVTQATLVKALSAEKAALFRSLALKECGGKDGGAPGDGFLNAPLACRVAPARYLCKAGAPQADCLTEGEVTILNTLYDGARNPRTGELIYFPLVRGGEVQAAPLLGTPKSNIHRAPGDLSSWMSDGAARSDRFDFDQDVDALNARFGPDINALSTDLSEFAARGGKIIMYHGWEDGVVSPLDTVAYFEAIEGGDASPEEFARLYMVPGMQHCMAGEGPRPLTPDDLPDDGHSHDELLAVLDRWIEQGEEPTALTGYRFQDGEVNATRPLCPYPSVAHYDGAGDPDKASSFSCRTSAKLAFERPPPRYLFGTQAPDDRVE